MNRHTEYKNAKTTEFILRPSTQVFNDHYHDQKAINCREWKDHGMNFPRSQLPEIRDFPLNRMAVRQSFMMHKEEHYPGRFVDVRERIRRCNNTQAAYFVAVWINDRQTLEIARVA